MVGIPQSKAKLCSNVLDLVSKLEEYFRPVLTLDQIYVVLNLNNSF